MRRAKLDISEMAKAIATLETEEEVVEFLQDLCAPNELKSMNQRYAVMKLLCQNKVYTEIMEKTGASTATISRVKRVQEDGNGIMENLIRAQLLQEENGESL